MMRACIYWLACAVCKTHALKLALCFSSCLAPTVCCLNRVPLQLNQCHATNQVETESQKA